MLELCQRYRHLTFFQILLCRFEGGVYPTCLHPGHVGRAATLLSTYSRLDLGVESLNLRPRQIAKHHIAMDASRQGLDAGSNVHVVFI